MYEGKFNLKAGSFQDAANAVKKEKQFIQPDAPKIASVSSDNEVFQDRNKELMKQIMKLIYSKLYLRLRFKGKCLYIFL